MYCERASLSRLNSLPLGFENRLGILECPVLGLLVPHAAWWAEADLELLDHLQGLCTVVEEQVVQELPASGYQIVQAPIISRGSSGNEQKNLE